MTKLLIASSSDPDLRYALGTSVPDPIVLVDTGVRRYVLAPLLEEGRLARHAKRVRGLRVLPLERYGAKQGGLARAALNFLRERGIRRVLMSPESPAGLVEALRGGVDVRLGTLYPERRRKSARERAAIRKVRDATVAALEACLALIRRSRAQADGLRVDGASLTVERLRALARTILAQHGCVAPGLIISHGAQTRFPHEEGSGVLRPGEPIIMDFFPQSMESGYWFDMTRTVWKGRAPAAYRRLWTAVLAAQRAALKEVRDGVPVRRVHAAAARVFEAAGFPTRDGEGFLHSTGHGVGLEIHEAPWVGPVPGRLREGDVITIEPGLYYRHGGARLEDTVLVTKNGWRDLTRFPKELEL